MRFPVVAVLCCSLALGVLSFSPIPVSAQDTMPAPKKPLSPPAKAEVSLAGAEVSVDYSAPSMKGRVIFGGLVPYDEVWRTGANAATTLKTSGSLKIGDLTVPSGTYTLYSLPTKGGMKLIVNKQTGQWGTVYDAAQDLGRVEMKMGSNATPVETMVLDFENTMGGKTELHVKWAGVDASVAVTSAQ